MFAPIAISSVCSVQLKSFIFYLCIFTFFIIAIYLLIIILIFIYDLIITAIYLLFANFAIIIAFGVYLYFLCIYFDQYYHVLLSLI